MIVIDYHKYNSQYINFKFLVPVYPETPRGEITSLNDKIMVLQQGLFCPVGWLFCHIVRHFCPIVRLFCPIVRLFCPIVRHFCPIVILACPTVRLS